MYKQSGIKLVYEVVIRLLLMRTLLSQGFIHNPVEMKRVFSLGEIEYY